MWFLKSLWSEAVCCIYRRMTELGVSEKGQAHQMLNKCCFIDKIKYSFQIGDEHLGRNARTVFRDKSGKRRNLKEEQKKQKEEDEKKAAEMAKYAQWGKGSVLFQNKTRDLNPILISLIACRSVAGRLLNDVYMLNDVA